MRKCTQADIARIVGVSQRAVASVVGKGSANNKVRVSERTRKKILEVAEKLNYRPSHQAQLLRGGKSRMIGILKARGFAEYHYNKIYCTVESLYAHGYRSMTVDYHNMDMLGQGVEMILDAAVQGVCLIGFSHESFFPPLLKLKEYKVPVVALPAGGLSIFPSVLTDHGKGVSDLVEHLVQQGHRKLFYVGYDYNGENQGNPFHFWTYHERMKGFWRGVEKYGIKDAELFQISRKLLVNLRGKSIYYPGKVVAQKLLERGDLPDAILCSNDEWALGLMGELFRQGVRIPQDVAVTGFDGASLGGHSIPRLTTIRQDAKQMGEIATQLLVKLINGESIPEQEQLTLVPGELIVRESSLKL